MRNMKGTSVAKPVLLLLCAIAFSLSAIDSTKANSRINTAARTAVTPSKASSAAFNAREANRLLRDISRKVKANPKLASSLATACNCAAACNDLGGSGSCFKGCLDYWGISAASLAACGAVCTGNLIGCAVCVGVSEWIILGCAQYCAWGGGTRLYLDTMSTRPLRLPQKRGIHQAKLMAKRALASS